MTAPWFKIQMDLSRKWSISSWTVRLRSYTCNWETVMISRNQCSHMSSVITINKVSVHTISPQDEVISLGRYLKPNPSQRTQSYTYNSTVTAATKVKGWTSQCPRGQRLLLQWKSLCQCHHSKWKSVVRGAGLIKTSLFYVYTSIDSKYQSRDNQ